MEITHINSNRPGIPVPFHSARLRTTQAKAPHAAAGSLIAHELPADQILHRQEVHPPGAAQESPTILPATETGSRTLQRMGGEAHWDPANKDAEQLLRTEVLWRKRGFGSRGERGARLGEQALTTLETLRLQGAGVFEILDARSRLTALEGAHIRFSRGSVRRSALQRGVSGQTAKVLRGRCPKAMPSTVGSRSGKLKV